jgi:hypothetical protein
MYAPPRGGHAPARYVRTCMEVNLFRAMPPGRWRGRGGDLLDRVSLLPAAARRQEEVHRRFCGSSWARGRGSGRNARQVLRRVAEPLIIRDSVRRFTWVCIGVTDPFGAQRPRQVLLPGGVGRPKRSSPPRSARNYPRNKGVDIIRREATYGTLRIRRFGQPRAHRWMGFGCLFTGTSPEGSATVRLGG